MEQNQICPWCLTEIVWDEEIGPESHCPHCENELGGYRTMRVGLGAEDEADAAGGNDADDWLDEEELDEQELDEQEEDAGGGWMDADSEGFRGASRSSLAAEGAIQRIIDEQGEVPECPVCREYMLEAGEQSVGGEQFRPAVPPSLGIPVVPNPFRLIWYICPSCYHTSSQLSHKDREEMLRRLAGKNGE